MSIKKFPGLIDPHVHLRDPGATQKEDFKTGSESAVAGGFTFVIDMPNNPIPTVSIEALEEKIKLADEKSICDIGFHYGTNGENFDTFKKASENSRVFGLKIYCNHTTGDLLIDDNRKIEEVFKAWDSPKPILVHAEGKQLEMAIKNAKKHKRKLHHCHISKKEEVEMIREAKKKGLSISTGVCPHHLYLTKEARKEISYKAVMKPPLETSDDQKALWEGLNDGTVDIIETDHAPHLISEKESGEGKYGVPGLETSLGLMLLAVKEGKLSEEDIIRLMYEKPKELFDIPDQKDTYIEVDTEKSFVVDETKLKTKCGWSPFAGWELYGSIERVIFKGKEIYAT